MPIISKRPKIRYTKISYLLYIFLKPINSINNSTVCTAITFIFSKQHAPSLKRKNINTFSSISHAFSLPQCILCYIQRKAFN